MEIGKLNGRLYVGGAEGIDTWAESLGKHDINSAWS